jgi:uncharacterized protein
MTPAFQIIANGADATGTLSDRLLSITVTDEDGEKADRVEIEVDDRDGRVAFPELDTTLLVYLGFLETGLQMVGQFAVDGVSGAGGVSGQTMTITATAADLKSDIRAPRTRQWENKSLSDIVRTIAGEAGLRAVVGESVGATVWAYLAQTAESNLHFLTRIAATLDATAKPAGGALIVQRRGEGKSAAGDVLTPPVLGPRDLTDWRWRLEGRAVVKSVEAEWTDPANGTRDKVTKGVGKPMRAIRHMHATEDEATRAAEALLQQAGMAPMGLSASLASFAPGLLAGATVQVAGLRPELSGEWQIKRVTHRFGSGGLVSSFEGRKGAS